MSGRVLFYLMNQGINCEKTAIEERSSVYGKKQSIQDDGW